VSKAALLDAMPNKKQLEVAFIAVFSVLILTMFYFVISMNGVVLGNDPAVHLEKAQIFLNTQHISLANLGWTPPLYQIVLAMIISLSGAVDIGQYIVLLRVLTAVMDWLLFMAVYLVGSKFFSKRVGAVAAVLLLLCFPVYEANQFGGYTTVLALAFMLLVLLYTPLAMDKLGYVVVAFFAAFGLVLSHQLAAFLAVFIMPPILLFMLVKSRGKNLKVIVALALGGGIAFFLYYFQAMFGYLDVVIEYVFFAIKTYSYQIPAANFTAFMTNFGFIFFVALAGVAVSFYLLRKQKKPLYWLILVLGMFVPFFFAESYLVGFYMPFGWFIYYLSTPLVIFAAVAVVFVTDKTRAYYVNHRGVFKRNWIKALAILIILALSTMVVLQSNTVYGRIMEAGVYYSTTDLKALDAGIWLKENYPEETNVTCTEIPGFWFQEFSGKNVTAQTDLAVQRNELAEAVLTLSYELEHSQTMYKAYQAKGDTLDEDYVSMDQIWERVSVSSGSGDFLTYTVNEVQHKYALGELSKEIVFQDQTDPKSLTFVFTNDDVALNETVVVENTCYPFTVSWTLTPLRTEITNASLYLTTNFDLQYNFDKADIPGLLNWTNPWNAPGPIRTTNGNLGEADSWAVASFAGVNLKDSYIGLYDDTNDIGYAFKFNDLPDWGNIGALGNRQIDAVRFQYNLGDLAANQTATRSYETLALSKSSYSDLQPSSLQGLFNYTTQPFNVPSRDFSDYIKKDNIGFIVYDKNQLDTQIVNSKILQQVYSNDRYVIFKVLQ
jgi:hypothetical protein